MSYSYVEELVEAVDFLQMSGFTTNQICYILILAILSTREPGLAADSDFI